MKREKSKGMKIQLKGGYSILGDFFLLRSGKTALERGRTMISAVEEEQTQGDGKRNLRVR